MSLCVLCEFHLRLQEFITPSVGEIRTYTIAVRRRGEKSALFSMQEHPTSLPSAAGQRWMHSGGTRQGVPPVSPHSGDNLARGRPAHVWHQRAWSCGRWVRGGINGGGPGTGRCTQALGDVPGTGRCCLKPCTRPRWPVFQQD